SMGMLEPEDSHRDRPEGAVALGALVVAGGQRAELLAAGDQVLDAVAQPVGRAVEGAAAALVAHAGDGIAEAAAAAVGAPRAPGVALVVHHPLRAHPRPAAAGAPHRPPL